MRISERNQSSHHYKVKDFFGPPVANRIYLEYEPRPRDVISVGGVDALVLEVGHFVVVATINDESRLIKGWE